MPEVNAPKILNSWKEIASYLGRGVRTVQRWEANLGLPVRRPNQHMRSAVIAISDELDAWVRSAPKLLRENGNGDAGADWREVDRGASAATSVEASRALRASLQYTGQLRERVAQLRAEHAKTLAELITNVAEVERRTKECKEQRNARLLASELSNPRDSRSFHKSS
jgi:hypothetical protein